MTQPYRRLSSETEVGNGSSTPMSNGGLASPAGRSDNASRASSHGSTSSNTKTRAERFSEKIHALMWVVGSFALARYLDVPRVILTDQTIHRRLFNAAVVLLSINFVLMVYLGIYLPKIKGIRDPAAWEIWCPRVIPTMTGIGVFAIFFLIRSLWPKWGFLTPFIVGIEFFGILYLAHFIPWI